MEIPTDAIPVFIDAQHAHDTSASLHFDAAKNILTLRCKVNAAMTVAVVQRRTTRAASALPSTQPVAHAIKSPMGELARRVYVGRTTRIVDEGTVEWTDDQLIHWPSVILYGERR
jgi:hypothetical protein